MRWEAAVAVVGRGPAGLAAATFLTAAHIPVVVVADGRGTLELWSGEWHFLSREGLEPVSDPYAVWEHRPPHPQVRWSRDAWGVWWGRLVDAWRAAGIPVPERVPSRNCWTLGSAGVPRPTFVAAGWQYQTQELEPLWLVGFSGLSDSLVDWQAAEYEAACGRDAGVSVWEPPAELQREGSPLRWAAYFERHGVEDLAADLRRALPAESRGRPLVLPQVMGFRRTEALLDELQRRLDRPVAELPLGVPCLGGWRWQQRWESWLTDQGVGWIQGRVVQIGDGRIVLDDGRTWRPAGVILATGGVLGGGIAVGVDGQAVNTATGEPLGMALTAEDLEAVGLPARGAGYATAGRSLAGCQPDREGDGGAMNVWSAAQAVAWWRGGAGSGS